MKKRVFEVLKVTLGIEIILLLVKLLRNRKLNTSSSNDKMAVYYNLMNKWMMLREENKSISDYMERHGFQTIAIYGLGDIGKHLKKELQSSNIVIKYAIDKETAYLTTDLDVYSPKAELPLVDAVIVTPVMDYDEICKTLGEKVSYPILSITDVINELLGII